MPMFPCEAFGSMLAISFHSKYDSRCLTSLGKLHILFIIDHTTVVVGLFFFHAKLRLALLLVFI